jgi:hypothetical protein
VYQREALTDEFRNTTQRKTKMTKRNRNDRDLEAALKALEKNGPDSVFVPAPKNIPMVLRDELELQKRSADVATSDLKQVVRKLRNVARNVPAAHNACVDMAGDIEDVINLLEGNAQHP